MQTGRAMKVITQHLDAKSTALERNLELRKLANSVKMGECRIVCNVKLFTEGVDVPSLDAVAFLDPRDSQVDVVQAVGRVMRKAEGKRFGYIIIPVVVDPGKDVAAALESGSEGYNTIGRVLRALQSHDERLIESFETYVKIYEQKQDKAPGNAKDGSIQETENEQLQQQLELKEAEQAIYAHIATASGLGKPGVLVADEISHVVRRASAQFQEEETENALAEALDLVPEVDGGAKGICTIAALMLSNACLLQRRLSDEPSMKTVMKLEKIMGAKHPQELLQVAWESILEKDYAPVFQPALSVLEALHENIHIDDSIRMVAECANRVADSLSELGYDHAGPLYHRILGSAKSDGAFYTNNVSGLMLARLAFNHSFTDWSDPDAVAKLKIMDPACGTGTLLMAALKTIKERVAKARKLGSEEADDLHKRLVEDVLCGLDINKHGVQLAACNMTLGAPTVDYERMNLITMPHGPQATGDPKAGSLEILTTTQDDRDLQSMAFPSRSLENLEAAQVNTSAKIDFPLHDLDAIIMNAPYTSNKNRNKKYGTAGAKKMQIHEQGIKQYLERSDTATRGVVTENSIRTFFTPLAELLLAEKQSTLAIVIPTTACTSESGVAERRFLAEKFHIETILTSHDPSRPNFSENTSISESLLICRRRITGGGHQMQSR